MSNLDLWAQVDKTDTEYTKFVNQRGGYTAIDPHYQAMKATEIFGPHGIGWGFESSEFGTDLIESTGMVIHKAVFFYVLNGERGSFPIHNAVSIFSDKKRERPDEDFAKKVETNTISKALSKLGFSADVFMGKFEDSVYVENLNNELALEKADNKAEEEAQQKAIYQEWFDTHLKLIQTAASMNELEKVFIMCIRKANSRGDTQAVKAFTESKDVRKGELNNG